MAEDTAPQLTEERRAEVQAQADFESGMPAEAPKPARGAKPDAAVKPDAVATPDPKPIAAKPDAAAEPAQPEYVRITKEQFASLEAAAAKTASYDAQFSRVFGTVGNLQKTLTALQTATPRGGKVEIPKDAFAGMERDFPELAEHTRAALEATLRGLTGTGPANADIDPDLIKRLVTEHATQARADAVAAEIKELQADHPDWAKIVGKVDMAKGERPDPANPFRKWLATKSPAYQRRLNSTESAAVISDAIDLFQSETKAAGPKAPSLQAQLQAARIRGAVQPRGDGGHAAAPTDDQQFEAGYASR